MSAIGISKVQNTILNFVDSKLEISYHFRGNKIYFAGADDLDKIKSFKDADFTLAIMWIEELTKFKTEEEVTSIESSVFRKEL